MKKVIAVAVFLLALVLLRATVPNTQNVTLAWDASPDSTVVEYFIYYGPSSGNYTNKIPSGGATSLTVSNLAVGGTYYFVATAADSTGLESVPSNEIFYTVPTQYVPGPPSTVSLERMK